MIDIRVYETRNGFCPYEEWLDNLKSNTAKSRILKAMTRLEKGLICDSKSVGGGVHEIRLHFEKGYRLYFGYDGDRLIVLLMGSDKKKQDPVIKEAKEYWQDYKKRKKEQLRLKGRK